MLCPKFNVFFNRDIHSDNNPETLAIQTTWCNQKREIGRSKAELLFY